MNLILSLMMQLLFFQSELRNLIDSFPANFSYARDLIRHNLVVFRSGEGAFQVLPLLMNSIPEAKLNLIIYYLKNGTDHFFPFLQCLLIYPLQTRTRRPPR